MPEVLFPTIVSGTTTGADAAVMLNSVGKDDEISIRRVSAIANVGTEISFYKNGTVVYAELEKKFYKYSSVDDVWSITTDYPSPFNTGNLTAGSTKVSVVGGTNTLVNGSASVDVNESNIQHQNLNGAGTNTHAQILRENTLAWLNSTLNNTMDVIALCITPITTSVGAYGSLTVKEY